MTGTQWPCTAEEIIEERDAKSQSWKQVAVALNLGEGKKNRGRYAQHAYEELTGLSRHDSRPLGGRIPSAGTNGAHATPARRQRALRTQWDDDTDQGEIEAALMGVRVENEKTGSVSWRPVKITVQRTVYGRKYTEEISCRYATEFSYGPEGDQPLQVSVVENYAGASRTVYVADVVKVSR